MLSTPIRSDEFLLGKAIAALIPAVAVSYLVYALFVGFVLLFTPQGIAPALLQTRDITAQIVLTPLLSALATWISIAVSTRFTDVRVAQQLSLLANLPLVLVTSLVAFEVIPVTAVPLGPVAALLVVCDLLGWRLVVPLFDRERLITSR
jgi:ABC-2 type transport system permease protein